SDVWAVGEQGVQTLTEHWDGTQWSIVPSPNVGDGENFLAGVASTATDEVWAVGYHDSMPSGTLIERWNGTSWSVVSSPNPDVANVLSAVASVPGYGAIAVGHSYPGSASSFRTLAEHYITSCTTPSATPTHTHTPTATATDTPTE